MPPTRNRRALSRCADRQSAARAASGFTLIEIMVVVAIIGLLLTLMAPQFFKYLRSAKVTTTHGKMQNLKLPLQQYRNLESKMPDSLEALLEPSEKNMNEPYVDSEDELNDAWGNRMQFVKLSGSKYDIISLGADGVEGGEADDADIHSAKTDIPGSKP
ncbi:MAG TPA: type II secretion system protein GspG [Planctomycetota bacterium]|nr:type II secretion system protein GspG [Planctomycetota bacterium]